jgi:cytochrome c556
MKSFKEFITEMKVELSDLLGKDEVSKLEKYYGGNDAFDHIYQELQDYKKDHSAFIKNPDKVSDQVKKSMISVTKKLRKMGKEDGVLK